MKAAHDAFEALAGAIALGEAAPDECARFEAHAAVCPACRSDRDAAEVFVPALAAARADERWRPSVGAVVLGRIVESRAKRSRWTLVALGWGAGLSLALNAALAGGFSPRFAGPFAAARAAATVAPAHAAATVAPARAAATVASSARATLPRRTRPLPLEPAAVAGVRPAERRLGPGEHRLRPGERRIGPGDAAPAERAPEALPDVLDGLDVDGATAQAPLARRVAVDTPVVCDPQTPGLARTEPCPANLTLLRR